MIRLIQKLDKFHTNNQKIYQISKFDSSIKNQTLHSVNFSFILTNQGRENSAYAIRHCILKWNGHLFLLVIVFFITAVFLEWHEKLQLRFLNKKDSHFRLFFVTSLF
jgi:hypothetical protein